MQFFLDNKAKVLGGSIYCLFCIGLFEYAYFKTRRYRAVDEARDGAYPLCRRRDVPKWARWKFYPGAILFMPLRLLLTTAVCLSWATLVKLLCLGHNFDKGPITGCRKLLVKWVMRFSMRSILCIAALRTKRVKLDYDYSKYLGPDYKKTQEVKRESTVICNHMSWLDGPIMYLCFETSFCPMAGLKKVPLFGTLA